VKGVRLQLPANIVLDAAFNTVAGPEIKLGAQALYCDVSEDLLRNAVEVV